MTKIIVTPIDRSARGSYREIKSLMALSRAISPGADFNPSAFLSFLDIVEKHCTLPDGGDIAAELEELSFDQFMELAQAITGSSVGEATASD